MTVILSTLIEDRPIDVTIRAHRALTKEASLAVGKHWHKKMLPKHFTSSNRHTYGYKSRTKVTREKKRALASKGFVQKGGTVDLVWSGQVEAAAKNNVHFAAYPSRCTVDMIGPPYFTINPRDGRRPNLGREVLATTVAERRELNKVWLDTYNRALAKLRARKTTKL